MTDLELKTVLSERLEAVRTRIAAAARRAGLEPDDVTLVAVTKSVSTRVAGLLPELGVLDLGESRPQELWRKAEALRGVPIRWHMIGHFQRNKVERTLPLVHLVHSVDSARLLEEIESQARKQGLRPHLLLQINASHEEQKHGFDADELVAFLPRLQKMSVKVVGLMGMAALSPDPEQARPAFRALKTVLERHRGEHSPLAQLSMGMSGDYEVGIEEGATLVRVGSTLFEGLEGE